LTPVIVEGSSALRGRAACAWLSLGSSLIEIVIGDAAARVPPGTDTTTLQTVLRP
jgi:hypothetical protein